MTTRTGWWQVLALWLAGLGAAAQFAKMSVTFADLAALYDAAPVLLGFIVSLVGFVGIVLGVVAGVVVARTGFRRALLGALLLGAALSLFQASLPALPLLLLSRVAEGVSHLAIVVAAPTLIAQVSRDRDRGITLSLWSTFFGVAFAVLIYGGLPIVARFGPGGLFLAHAVYMAAMAGVLALVLPKDAVSAAARGTPGDVLRAHVRLYRSPRLSAAALGWLCYAGCFLAILTVMPPFLPEVSRATVTGLMPLAGIALSMTLGVWLLRKVAAVPVVLLGFALSLGAAAVVWAAPAQPAGYLILAALLGLVQGASFAAVPQLNPDAADQALANGGMAQMGNVGTTLGTPVLAALVGWGGIHGFAVFATVLLIGGFGVHAALALRRRGDAA